MSVFTLPIVFTAIGLLVHFAGVQMLGEEEGVEALRLLAEITLVLVLFSDASQVRFASLRMNAGVPARMLLVAMPLAILFGAAVAWWVQPSQPMALAVLVAAVLAPTDAALGQAVISSSAVPEKLREAIAVESGLNDGLALPVVIMAALAAVAASGGASEVPQGGLIRFGLLQVTLGPLAGIAVGYAAARLRDMAASRELATESFQGIYFLASAFLCFLLAEGIGGNGLIAAFVGGLTFGQVRKKPNRFVGEFMESEGQLLTIATFVVFGAVLAPVGLAHATLPTLVLAIAFLSVVRVSAVVLSLTGSGLAWKDKLFLGWFGPRGLASILFALLVVKSYEIPGVDEVVACVTMTVMLSIFLHGISALPILRAYERGEAK